MTSEHYKWDESLATDPATRTAGPLYAQLVDDRFSRIETARTKYCPVNYPGWDPIASDNAVPVASALADAIAAGGALWLPNGPTMVASSIPVHNAAGLHIGGEPAGGPGLGTGYRGGWLEYTGASAAVPLLDMKDCNNIEVSVGLACNSNCDGIWDYSDNAPAAQMHHFHNGWIYQPKVGFRLGASDVSHQFQTDKVLMEQYRIEEAQTYAVHVQSQNATGFTMRNSQVGGALDTTVMIFLEAGEMTKLDHVFGGAIAVDFLQIAGSTGITTVEGCQSEHAKSGAVTAGTSFIRVISGPGIQYQPIKVKDCHVDRNIELESGSWSLLSQGNNYFAPLNCGASSAYIESDCDSFHTATPYFADIFVTGSNTRVIRRPLIGNGSPPASGNYTRGEVCWNLTPSGSGVPGWVCTASGAPGTWKAMAVLAA